MNKRMIYSGIFFVLLMLLVTSALVNTSISKWEPSNAISTSIGNLQEVISSDILRTADKNSVLDFPALNPGHNLSEVWVSVNGSEMTFEDAIQNTDLCGIANPRTTYLNPLDPGHLGTEVEISTGKSLQDAINNGSLVGNWGYWSSCTADYKTRACFCGTDGSSVCPGSSTEFCGTWLYNQVHTAWNCTQAGGSVYSYSPPCPPGYSCPTVLSPPINFCKFPGSSCPADASAKPDWTQYENWDTTSKTTSPPLRTNALTCYLAWTNSHNFANTLIESCEYHRDIRSGFVTNCNYAKTSLNTCPSTLISTSPVYIYATRTEIGCY